MRAGDWTVEVVEIRDRQWFRVKRYGYLVGGGPGWRTGLLATVEEVRELLGEDFERLQ
jgi:hypothetical protein